LLGDVVERKPDFAFLSAETVSRAADAFRRGIDCILRCQIRVNGQLTAWCQQHDAETLAPTSARTYELPSICTYESASIVHLLMELPEPEPRVIEAVDSAVAWFERSKITGKRYEKIVDPALEYGVDRVLKDDPAAPPLWARFYDIETNQPFFCDRDGVKRWKLEEVGAERRARYAWFTTSPQRVIDAYPKWRARILGEGK
ncbi:MAG: pectate lyase, partial [Phycisphaerae bacterium]|nr:pectate lyase [Phycisphaerae bacterium]MDW8261282.1 pectate lyase [Phycisphaerales bacterium]